MAHVNEGPRVATIVHTRSSSNSGAWELVKVDNTLYNGISTPERPQLDLLLAHCVFRARNAVVPSLRRSDSIEPILVIHLAVQQTDSSIVLQTAPTLSCERLRNRLIAKNTP